MSKDPLRRWIRVGFEGVQEHVRREGLELEAERLDRVGRRERERERERRGALRWVTKATSGLRGRRGNVAARPPVKGRVGARMV
jgi:hypothetical protein